jgi:thymidylate synthase ThyX
LSRRDVLAPQRRCSTAQQMLRACAFRLLSELWRLAAAPDVVDTANNPHKMAKAGADRQRVF